MVDMNKAVADFLSVIPQDIKGYRGTEYRQHVIEALNVVASGLAAGSILNVDFQDAKRTLDYAAEVAFKQATEEYWVGKGGVIDPSEPDHSDRNRALCKLHWDGRVSYVRDAIARSKMLAKTKLEHPMVDAMRRVVAAVLPLAQAMEELKGMVVKGRRPPTAEVLAERARKAAMVDSMPRATCGCCFGDQAVLPNGLIHDHGYRHPRRYWKTGSCDGRNFKPLEVSDEGPKYMVDWLSKAEKSTVERLARVQAATEHTFEDWNRKEVTVKVGDPRWASKHADIVYEVERALESIRHDLAVFQKVVAEWKPGYKHEEL